MRDQDIYNLFFQSRIQYYKKCISLNRPKVHSYLAKLYILGQQYADHNRCSRKCIHLNRPNVNSYLAKLYILGQQYSGHIRYYKRCILQCRSNIRIKQVKLCISFLHNSSHSRFHMHYNDLQHLMIYILREEQGNPD